MKTIRTLVLVASAMGLAGATGCASVSSALPTSTAVNGDAWYTEAIGLGYLTWGSKVWYCPAPSSAGPSTCMEAKLVELTKAEIEAEKPKK